MKSGEISIVVGIYMMFQAYMLDMVEWAIVGGGIFIFGIGLLVDEIRREADK